jgi:tetraacyldisaccharide 4'-kinase
MRWSRAILLFPLGLLWGLLALLKRKFYYFFKLSKNPPIATWVIGNIHAGGQGKTPTIIALYNWLNLENNNPLKIGILSRGYGRKSKGFRQVSYLETAKTVGDEPLEIFYTLDQNSQKKPNDIHPQVFVCENRFNGIQKIQKIDPCISMILLDDGFQHLNISALGNIILTKFEEPFGKNLPIPAGNLREFPSASKNADIILVTHSPKNLSSNQAIDWKVAFYRQMRFWGIKANTAKWFDSIYFASYSTTTPVKQSSLKYYSEVGNQITKEVGIILITGVASSVGIVNALKDYKILYHFEYHDHHSFTINDFINWSKKLHDLKPTNIVISENSHEKVNEYAFVCTRKDYMRIMSLYNELKIKQNSENTFNSNNSYKTKNEIDQQYFSTSNIIDLPFYVCHSEIEILFDQKTELLNKIVTS